MRSKIFSFIVATCLLSPPLSAHWGDDCSTYSFEVGTVYWKAFSVKVLLGTLRDQVSTTLAEDKALYLQSEYDWGIRLAGGYRICNSCYRLEAEYIRYTSSSNFTISVPETNPSIRDSIYFPFQGDAGNLDARQRIDLRSADLTLNRLFRPNCCCSFSILGGFRYYDYKVVINSSGVRTAGGVPARRTIDDSRPRCGIGPIFGVKAHCRIYPWLQFCFQGLLGGVAATAEVRTTTTTIESPPAQPQDITIVRDRQRFDVFEPVTQVRLSWCGDWCMRCATFYSEVGYEYRSYRSGVPSPQFAGLNVTAGVLF